MSNKKKALLHNLKHETYARIGTSKIAGVGVIAVRDIPKGINPFQIAGTKCPKYNGVKLSKSEVNSLPTGAKKLVKDFVYQEEDGSYFVPEKGMNFLNVSFYMNHSDKPNIDIVETDCDFMTFETNRKIRKGEELLINYSTFDD